MSQPSLEDRIKRIRTKLARRATIIPVRLGPPLAEFTVAEFENRVGVRLPSAYRAFLTEVGHGGHGPGYGLLPLEDWDAGIGWWDDDAAAEASIAQPFPVEPHTVCPPDWEDHYGEQLYQGTITVVHGGCTEFTLLVITGPARGMMVEVNEFAPPHFCPHKDFLDWYEHWLASAPFMVADPRLAGPAANP